MKTNKNEDGQKRAKFHKKTFENISEERRDNIIQVAMKEFASNGYTATNINIIASKAGISIGSMYNYFESKEALFLSIVQHGVNDLEAALKEVQRDDGDIFTILKRLFQASWNYAKQNPEMNQLYLDATTQGLSVMSAKLSQQIEKITYELYITIIENAKKKGEIDKNVNNKLVAFFIDNLAIMLQFSISADYYKERMKIFLNEGLNEDQESIIEGLVDLFRKTYGK
jgi:TetR/AcrR family transcriptional regulator